MYQENFRAFRKPIAMFVPSDKAPMQIVGVVHDEITGITRPVDNFGREWQPFQWYANKKCTKRTRALLSLEQELSSMLSQCERELLQYRLNA